MGITNQNRKKYTTKNVKDVKDVKLKEKSLK